MNKIVTEAISVLKLYRNDWSLGSQNNERLNKAIDTVVKELEKPLPTDDQIKQSITEAVEKEKECIRQFLIDDGYELLADKI